MNIREYEARDLEACRDIWRDLTQRHRDIYEDQTIGGDDPGPAFDAYLAYPNFHKLWVAEEDGELVGFCGLLADEDEAELEPICVRPSHRDKGIGAQLAQRVIEEARTLGKQWLNVRPVGRNIEAIAFFQREGFDHLGRLELSLRLEARPLGGAERKTDIHGTSFTF